MAEAGSIEVVPATPDRRDDVVTILGGRGDVGWWWGAPRSRVPDVGAAVGAR